MHVLQNHVKPYSFYNIQIHMYQCDMTVSKKKNL